MKIITYLTNKSSLNQVVYEAEHAIKRLNREVTLYVLGDSNLTKKLPEIDGLGIIAESVHEFKQREGLDDLVKSCDRIYMDDFVQDSKYSEYTQVLLMAQYTTVPLTLIRTTYNDPKAVQYRDDALFYIYDSNVGKRIAQGFDDLKEILSEMNTSEVTRVYLITHDNSFHSNKEHSLYNLIKEDPKILNHISSTFIIEDTETEEVTWEMSAKGVFDYAVKHDYVDSEDCSITGHITIYAIIEELPIAEIHKHILDKRADRRYHSVK